MLSTVPLTARRRRVFGSVFSPTSLDAHPATLANFDRAKTPVASFQDSVVSSSTTRTSRTSPFAPADPLAESRPDQENWDRAWRAATAFLTVPDRGFAALYEDRETDGNGAMKAWNRSGPPVGEAAEALAYLTGAGQQAKNIRGAATLIDWYSNEIRRHFLTNFRAGLRELLRSWETQGLLRTIVDCLQLARRIYFAPIVQYVLPLLAAPEQGRVLLDKLQRSFHTAVSYSLPWSQISILLTAELARDALVVLGIDTLTEYVESDQTSQEGMEVDRQYSVSYQDWRQETSAEARTQLMTKGEDARVIMARGRLLSFANGLQLVGLGGEKAQKVFATAMDIMMTEFVRVAYSGQWEAPTSVPQHLRQWIENVFARLAVEVLAIIHTIPSGTQAPGALDVNSGDVEKWQEIGIARLGALRTSELFDVIVEWPSSSGAVEDLRYFTTHPAARNHVTQWFIHSLNDRLLHPGASTVEILQLYISIIRAFHLLDPKGVLLDRIARPIRRYLKDREDTVRVIVSGLLAEPPAAGEPFVSSGDTLVELAAELSKAHQLSLQNNMGELDWDDMNWIPDPVDAAPDYKKSKSSDVIDSLVSLFDSKETFVKEMQTLLADRLLQNRTDFDQEMSVLELLKVRFGDSALQACEVMLRDIFDSRRVDGVVRNDQGLAKPAAPIRASQTRNSNGPEIHAKILSRFFWPEIQDQEFTVPDAISSLQQRYATGFEALKQSRKLTWRNGLGQVTVELDLEDRVFVDEVTTWQATVIYAFQSESGDTEDHAVSKTVADLADLLHMTTSLVRSACLFWVSKRILTEIHRDMFRVLEVLPSEDDQRGPSGGPDTSGAEAASGCGPGHDSANSAAAAAAAAAATAAKESAEAAALEKMNLYWQFIVGMLTNQGPMPLQRIVMMLKIAVPGGCPVSNEELREFLAGMVSRGNLEIASGGNYKIVH